MDELNLLLMLTKTESKTSRQSRTNLEEMGSTLDDVGLQLEMIFASWSSFTGEFNDKVSPTK